jgi:hypothetical protein
LSVSVQVHVCSVFISALHMLHRLHLLKDICLLLFCTLNRHTAAGQAAAAAADEADDHDDAAAAAAAPQASDELGSVLVLTSKHKLKSFAFSPAGAHKGSLGQLALGLSNNSVEVRGVAFTAV